MVPLSNVTFIKGEVTVFQGQHAAQTIPVGSDPLSYYGILPTGLEFG